MMGSTEAAPPTPDGAPASAPDPAPDAPARTPSARFVLVVVFVDMLASSIAIPVLPPLVLQILHGDAAASSGAVGLFGTAFAAMQFLFGPLQGTVSDRFGRRIVLVASCLGLAASQAVMALGDSIAVLLAARLLSGASAANLSTAAAYVADITEPDARAAAFGRIGVAFGSGLVFGPLIGGLCAEISLRAPFWLSAALALANAVWAFAFVAESLPHGLRRRFRLAQANPIGALGFLLSSPRLAGLSVSSLISLLAQQALISVFVLSATLRFHWHAGTLGLAMGAVGLCYAIVGGLLVKPVVAAIGERGGLAVGIGFGVIGFLILALAPNGIVYALSIPVISLWGLAAPATSGALSRLVGAEQQGRLQGATTALAGVAGIVGPGLFGGSLAFAIARAGPHLARLHRFAPDPRGLPFLIAAILLAAALPIGWRATRPED